MLSDSLREFSFGAGAGLLTSSRGLSFDHAAITAGSNELALTLIRRFCSVGSDTGIRQNQIQKAHKTEEILAFSST